MGTGSALHRNSCKRGQCNDCRERRKYEISVHKHETVNQTPSLPIVQRQSRGCNYGRAVRVWCGSTLSRKTLHTEQQELRVVLAHLRVISIDTVNAVAEWRVRCVDVTRKLQSGKYHARMRLAVFWQGQWLLCRGCVRQ